MAKKSPTTSATEKAPKLRKAAAAKPAPTHDEIALRAYHIYLQRHGAPGNPFDDWKQAEQQLQAEAAKSRARKSKIVPFAA